ncbi:MAG: energy transducer TonB [Flavobacteriales bacterium]|nr:energy transducer TonB [Flavobacteriales bacterium]MCB9449241.1 energy transducer TonB [Flavobacteriales bacterium]
MSVEKSPEADLERKRSSFLLISYVVVLAITLVAFRWKMYDRKLMDLGAVTVEMEEEDMIPVTRQDQPPPPPPPPPPAPPEELEIVKDDEEVNNDQDLFNSEADEEMIIEAPPPAEEEAAEPQVFVIVEDMPRFPGCENEKGSNQQKDMCAFQKMQLFLQKNMKYPPKAVDANITGTVHVGFVVLEDGSITSVKVLRGIGGGCDEEAIRVVNAMPKWKPGKQRGKAVRCSFTLPVRFQLR